MDRMLLVLKRSSEQEETLEKLLVEQQDKTSPNYHSWLSPEQFGQRFGASYQEIAEVTSWLKSHGFVVARVAKGRGVVEFSGTAVQVQEAFHTEIHKYEVKGKTRWANSADPAVPSALAPVIGGIVSLHNFPRRPLHHMVGVFSHPRGGGGYQFIRNLSSEFPMFTAGGGCGLMRTTCYAVVPYDLATIYNLLPLWNSNPSVDGTGQTIAIVGQSDIYAKDVSDFRSDFGLPAPKLNIIHDGPDPGNLATEGDELESDLDVEWAGAVAKGATVDFVVSGSTNTTAGVDLSAEYIVDNDLAPVMSESYGACELDMGTAGNQFYNQLWQQAAAEGITVFVSTGDSGSAVCDQGFPLANHGLAVNGISSTPYNVAVGGTDFDDLTNPGTYWNSTNDPVTYASAKIYIPESTWNDSCSNSEYFSLDSASNAEGDCNDASSPFWPAFLAPIGGSGGASNCTISSAGTISSCAGGYAKPSWQTGPGVPNDGKRDVPDISLFAGNGMNASFYGVCETDIYAGCAGDPYNLVAVGGTSASAPVLAGIMAIVNQKMQSRQGNANYVLYPLAVQPGASCDSSGTNADSCIFHDVTKGTSAMPCTSGSTNCVVNVPHDQNGILAGYVATAGYDLATGLGSINVTNLVNNWGTISFQPTVSTLSLNPEQITHGTPVGVNVAVAPKSGTGTPTGQVSLLASTAQDAGTFTLSNGSISGTTDILPGGSYAVTAHYAGDGTYGASDSPPVTVTVNPERSTTAVQAFTLDQKGNTIPYTTGPYGEGTIYLRANVAGQSGEGIPTGTVSFTQTGNGITTNLAGNPYPLNSEGYTMTPLPGGYYQFLSPGTYSVAASYNGDESFKASNSPAVTFSITQAQTTTALNIVPCSSVTGQCNLNPGTPVIIFASVMANTSRFVTNDPTGTVTFYSNGTPLSPPVAVDPHIAPAMASLSTQLPLGVANITAVYSGDTNYSGSASPASIVDVGGTFTMSANPTTINIASPGQSGSTTLTFAAQNGFTGSATLASSMCSNLPRGSKCSFNPSTIAFTSSGTVVPVTLSVSTTGPDSATMSAKHVIPELLGSRDIVLVSVMGICIAGAGIRRRRIWIGTMLLVTVAVIASLISCGGGSGGNTSVNLANNSGTPAGTYSVTLTVSINNVTQSLTNVNVVVQ